MSRALYIVNPVAGGGRGRRVAAEVEAVLRELDGDAELVFTRGPGDAETLARRGAEAGHMPIVAVGGDGTANEVANGLLAVPESPPLGLVPAGTGNDLARNLGLPLDPAEAVR